VFFSSSLFVFFSESRFFVVFRPVFLVERILLYDNNIMMMIKADLPWCFFVFFCA